MKAVNKKKSASDQKKNLDVLQNWNESVSKNVTYQSVLRAIKNKAQMFSSKLNLKMLISKCIIDHLRALQFYERKWISEYGNLQTRLVQTVHNFSLNSHSEQEKNLLDTCLKLFLARNDKECMSIYWELQQLWKQQNMKMLMTRSIKTSFNT